MGEYSIGVDLGGTNLRAAVVNRQGQMLEKISVSANPALGRESLVSHMVAVINDLRSRTRDGRCAGIGLGIPGFILLKEGVVRNSNNLACLEDFPFRDEMERRLETKVVLENDANAAALGEKWMGAGRDVDDLVLFTLGTGIGGGIISCGKVLHGFLGMAGELGHITVVPNGIPCGCGNRGCVEKHASATAITAMARLLGLGDNLSAQDVYELGKKGNEDALAVYRAMGESLGVALAMMANVFNFPLYLLSGGVLGAWDLFAPAMLQEARRRSFTIRTTSTRVEKAILGNEAGLYGAAYLPWAAEE